MSDTNVVTCVYCGHQYPNGTPAAKHELLTEHIKICDRHPMRDAEKKIERLKSAIYGLVGASNIKEINAMEAVIRATPAPASDKAAIIDAFDALRFCS